AQQPEQDQTGARRDHRPDAESRHPADGAWERRDPLRHQDHPVDAEPHDRPEYAVEAERHREEPEQTRRHHDGRHHRHRRKVREQTVGRDAMEVERGVGRRREPRHQRGQREHHELTPAPQRKARGDRMVGRCQEVRQPDLHQRHQPQRRGKRHLEARMHQRLRRDREHDQRRHRQRSEGDGAAVDDHRDQHHGRHEERPLGRDLRARQQQI
ncbi:hypothetical protein chiPu_0031677, partial [Chiloscyllium punctatum]|nr:hypothetical protein [Chiloscyllium punctatum]